MKHLLEFCDTDYQRQIVELMTEHGSQRVVAKMLGKGKTTIHNIISNIQKKAARRGFSPDHDMTKVVPDGYIVRGTSTFYGEDGKPRLQWVKSSIDTERQRELLAAAIGSMCEEIEPVPPVSVPIGTYGNLCNVYTLTDSHVGMLAWGAETQSGDWDLKIAEKTLVGCFRQMVCSAPPAKTCVIAQLGDFLHFDSALAAVTPLHGHNLDADGRMPKMVRAAIRILRQIVAFSLERHEEVVLLLAEGNHDISSSVWLRAMFQALYENEPRVKIIDSELPYYVYQHGEVMLGWHHGHLAKNDQLPLLFAAQFPKVWGNTVKRYVHCGHRHHTHIKEHSGITVEQHPTLAARDAYAARGGWVAERQVTAITYSDKFGQVARNTVVPEMLE